MAVGFYLRALNLKGRSAGDLPSSDELEVARLYRNPKTNRLVVELDGQKHAANRELDATQQERLASAAAELQSWLVEAATSPTSATATALPMQPSPAPAPSEAQQQPAAASEPGEIRPVAPRPLEAVSRVLRPNPAGAALQFKSIAAQINEMLQARLPGSPFEAVGMALVEMPDQSVVVQIGSEQYPGVEAVPDPEARNFIKAAVAEWEAKTRRGIK